VREGRVSITFSERLRTSSGSTHSRRVIAALQIEAGSGQLITWRRHNLEETLESISIGRYFHGNLNLSWWVRQFFATSATSRGGLQHPGLAGFGFDASRRDKRAGNSFA
jgi:hypothetical protein